MSEFDVFHYEGLTYWGPISDATMNRVVARMKPPSGAVALDIGCGRAELLVSLAERFGTRGTGVDRSAAALAEARTSFAERAPTADCELIEADVTTVELPAASFDVVAWLGGPYLGGDFASTITQLAAWCRPGGYVLVGHGFWHHPPPAEYLEATGISADEFGEHWQNLETGSAAGLRPLFCCQSDRHEWDAFEGTILSNVEHYAAANPDAPDPQGRLEQRRSWHIAQQRWGRDAMGFGLYLFMR